MDIRHEYCRHHKLGLFWQRESVQVLQYIEDCFEDVERNIQKEEIGVYDMNDNPRMIV